MEVQDTFFRTDSAVVHQNLVCPSVFALALLFAKGSPSARLVIAGHTDTRAPDAYNQPLSEERAANALACLMGDRDSFVRLSLARHKIADAKQILKFVTVKLGFDCDPGPFDENEATLRGPARKLQEQYNSKLAALGIPNATALPPTAWWGRSPRVPSSTATTLSSRPWLRQPQPLTSNSSPSKASSVLEPQAAVGTASVTNVNNPESRIAFTPANAVVAPFDQK